VIRIVLGTLFGAIASFLTRPCCVIPAVMSAAGLGSAGVAQATVAYRPAFLGVSAVMLIGSFWITFRRDGGWFTKILAASATAIGFVIFLESF
jgi:hypothetical protein